MEGMELTWEVTILQALSGAVNDSVQRGGADRDKSTPNVTQCCTSFYVPPPVPLAVPVPDLSLGQGSFMIRGVVALMSKAV